jgi:hypothetical protein
MSPSPPPPPPSAATFPCYGLLFRGASCVLFAVRRAVYLSFGGGGAEGRGGGERATDELIASVGRRPPSEPELEREGCMQMK